MILEFLKQKCSRRGRMRPVDVDTRLFGLRICYQSEIIFLIIELGGRQMRFGMRVTSAFSFMDQNDAFSGDISFNAFTDQIVSFGLD